MFGREIGLELWRKLRKGIMPKNSSRFTVPIKRTPSGKSPDRTLSIIIPAAGAGHRMRSYGPKCLLPVGGKNTVMGRALNIIKDSFEYNEIILIVGFEADKIIDVVPNNIRIVENQNYESSNTAESLRLGLNNCVGESVLILHGDIIFNQDIIESVGTGESSVVISNHLKTEKIGLTVVNDYATHFAYGLDKKWGQIAYLTGQELDICKSVCRNRKRGKLYTFEILNLVMENGGKLRTVEADKSAIMEIDCIRDLQK